MTTRQWIVVGFFCLALAIAAYTALHRAQGPVPIFIHVRWSPTVDDAGRQQAEQRHGLSDGERMEGTTWGYTLDNPDRDTIERLVRDPAVADTHELNRTTFQPSPTAEQRPRPQSNSRLRVSLWGVTVIALLVGLTAVSVGLIQGGTPAAWSHSSLVLASPTEARLTPRDAASLLFIVGIFAGCFVAAKTMEPRVDEANHLGQIQRYAAGNYVTTSTASGGFHAAGALFARATGDAEKENMRMFMVIVSALTVAVFHMLTVSLHPRVGPMRTLQFAFFPLLFPFWFLIYTDVLALLLLLISVLTLRWGRFHASGVALIMSMAVRQSYVVWLALVGVWTALISRGLSLPQLAARALTLVVAGTLFMLFVLINGGVAIGDRDSHPDMQLHTENVIFMLVCFFLTFLPLILSQLRHIARLPPTLLLPIAATSVTLLLAVFRVDHPYNDNVVTGDVFLRNELLALMTASTASRLVSAAVIAVATLSLFVIRLRQPIQYLIYPFAALSVMPVWLIEQRYYLPAFALFMAFREPASPAVERAILATNGVLATYLFAGVVQGWFFL